MNKKQQRQQKMLRQQEIVNAAKEAGRDLTAEEQTEFDSLQREIERLNGEIEAEEQQQRGMNPQPNAPPQNPANPEAHYRKTAVELSEQLGKKIDIYVSGVGSGGTLQGIAKYLLEQNPDTKIVAVEPKGVSALHGDGPGIHQIQGIGDGFIPDVLDTGLITDVVEVSDEDAINTARKLAKEQGLLVGTSSGANVFAAMQMAEKYGKDKVIATVLADRAERYFSTGLI